MIRISGLLAAAVLWLVFLPVGLASEKKKPDVKPETVLDIDYAKEDLEADPPVVVGTGKIHLRHGDAEVLIEDGGVVLWVDADRWRAFRRGEVEAGPEGLLGETVREIYAEGNVTLRRGDFVISAERLYVNFAEHRALVIKGELLARIGDDESGPRVPVLIRAERIVQTAKNRIESRKATLSTNLYALPHHEIEVDELVLERRGDDVTFTGDSLTLKYLGLPIFWFPFISASTGLGTDPIRDVKVGTSSKFGVFGGVVVGYKLYSGDEKEPWGDIEAFPVYRSRRGPGTGGRFKYELPNYYGRLEGFYQYDTAEEDKVLDTDIPHENRGRVKWQHFHEIDEDWMGGRLHGTAEIAWLSDRGFLAEYYTNEFKEGKAQEDVAYLSWGGDDFAVSATGKWQINDFVTQTEYRPRGRGDLFRTALVTDFLGTGTDVYLDAESEFAKIYRNYDEDADERGALTNRLIARGTITAPFNVGPVRVSPEFGGGTTIYDQGQNLNRLDFHGSIRGAIDFWKVFPDVRSDLFDLSGIRHVIDVSAGYVNRYGVTDASDEIVVQDSADLLDEIEAFDMRLRNRFQTKRDGEIVDFIDLEFRGVFFVDSLDARPSPLKEREEFQQGINAMLLPEEETWREIDRRGWGPITGELRCRLRSDLLLAADVWYDMETDEFETYSEAIRYDAGEDLSLLLAHRAIHEDSSIVTAWVDFKLSDRWGARVMTQRNLRSKNRLASGIDIRRALPDFILDLSFRYNEKRDETAFSITVEPTKVFERRRARERQESLDFDRMKWYR